MREDGRVRQTRELKSDFLLVKTAADITLAFRDVIEVDGKPVRNREDRLRKLFLDAPKTALEQARALAVRYAEEPKLKLMVPVDVLESYWSTDKPKADRLEVTCSYTNFRRFDVTYGEQIKVPK